MSQNHTLVAENIIKLWPLSAPLVEAGRLINLSKTATYVARARGNFPLRVSDFGGRLVVLTADLLDFIETGISQSNQSVAIKKKKLKAKKTGRPNKMESLAAAGQGLTVTQLRAAARVKS